MLFAHKTAVIETELRAHDIIHYVDELPVLFLLSQHHGQTSLVHGDLVQSSASLPVLAFWLGIREVPVEEKYCIPSKFLFFVSFHNVMVIACSREAKHTHTSIH